MTYAGDQGAAEAVVRGTSAADTAGPISMAGATGYIVRYWFQCSGPNEAARLRRAQSRAGELKPHDFDAPISRRTVEHLGRGREALAAAIEQHTGRYDYPHPDGLAQIMSDLAYDPESAIYAATYYLEGTGRPDVVPREPGMVLCGRFVLAALMGLKSQHHASRALETGQVRCIEAGVNARGETELMVVAGYRNADHTVDLDERLAQWVSIRGDARVPIADLMASSEQLRVAMPYDPGLMAAGCLLREVPHEITETAQGPSAHVITNKRWAEWVFARRPDDHIKRTRESTPQPMSQAA